MINTIIALSELSKLNSQLNEKFTFLFNIHSNLAPNHSYFSLIITQTKFIDDNTNIYYMILLCYTYYET